MNIKDVVKVIQSAESCKSKKNIQSKRTRQFPSMEKDLQSTLQQIYLPARFQKSVPTKMYASIFACQKKSRAFPQSEQSKKLPT